MNGSKERSMLLAMNNISPFEVKGNWYKGNLHCHSTVSDGKLAPEDVVSLYRGNGWNFLAFTDHRVFADWNKLGDEDFLIIPGVELNVDASKEGRPICYHILGIQGGKPGQHARLVRELRHGDRWEPAVWQGIGSVQALIDELKSRNNHVILCHPVWSLTEFEDLKDLEGYFAIEIYNHGCELECHTGLSTLYWDSLLKRGKRIWGVAVDDAHHRIQDECGGWVMVKAPSLTRSAIAEALVEGRFYSSSGPIIEGFGIDDGEAFVRSSPVKSIHFMTGPSRGESFHAAPGESITTARYRLKGSELYVRAECVDGHGKTAWTNPIFLAPVS
ncbi:MAG: PHP domain-containing protein [Firmicutes bacterium]|nr:PHP domain-containing protein [Bacillota bacterium]